MQVYPSPVSLAPGHRFAEEHVDLRIARERPARSCLGNRGQQLVQANRLAQVAMKACPLAAQTAQTGCVAGERDESALAQIRAQGSAELISVHAGQVDVENCDVRSKLGCDGHGAERLICHSRLVAFRLQRFGDDVSRVDVIVDD